jgi:hypothetical protein
MGSYAVHMVMMCFLSFIGLVMIHKTFQPVLWHRSTELFAVILLMPSILFWGSGVLKDGILLLAMGGTLYFFQRLMTERFQWKYFIAWVLAVLMLSITKAYVLLVMLPGLMAWAWVRLTSPSLAGLKFLTVHVLFFIAVFNANSLLPGLKIHPAGLLAAKQRNFNDLAMSVKAGSHIQIGKLRASAASVIENSPAAFIRVLTRPFITEASSPVMGMAAIENLLLLLMVGLSILAHGSIPADATLLWLCVFFTLGIFTLTGLITPIMGAMVRYKMPALPFFAAALLMVSDRNTQKQWLTGWFRRNG